MNQILNFEEFLKSTDISLKIPQNIERIKIDIGLSYNAPNSQKWLSEDRKLMVFGFEPNRESVKSILSGAIKKDPSHGDPLEIKYIKENRFCLIPCALGKEQKISPFFITNNDPGCSSLYTPKYFDIKCSTILPVYTLSDFFSIFPFDEKYKFIDHIKIDAQGSDLDILKGAGKYLEERVVFVTIETEDNQYYGTDNSEQSVQKFMNEKNFIRVYDQQTSDPTFLNKNFIEISHLIKVFQKG